MPVWLSKEEWSKKKYHEQLYEQYGLKRMADDAVGQGKLIISYMFYIRTDTEALTQRFMQGIKDLNFITFVKVINM